MSRSNRIPGRRTPGPGAVLRGGSVLRGQARRSRAIRRASAGLSPIRAGAALAMLVSALAVYGVAASPAFGLRSVGIEGAVLTDERAVGAALGVAPGTNLFTISTDALEDRLLELPTIAAARVSAVLPDRLEVVVDERDAILVWRVDDRRFLVDPEGTLFAELGERPPPGAAALTVIDDRRRVSRRLAVGARLEPVDLDAATRLGSVRPVHVGSAAPRLTIGVTDEHGFVVRPAVDDGWTAVFGFYTPSLRTPDIIPGQVRLLRGLLSGREDEIERVVLASETDGTYVPKPSSPPPASPAP